jgi:hypothetical protein
VKKFKFLLVSLFLVIFAPISFAAKKITSATRKKIMHDSVVFFDLLNKGQKISFDEQVKKSILNLYIKCRENDLVTIKEMAAAFNKEQKAKEIVTATLLFAINRKDKVVGKNLLEKQVLRKFIFDAFKEGNKVALKLLRYSIDLGTDKHAFVILAKLFSNVFLLDEDNDTKKELPEDGLKEQMTEFFREDDCDILMQFLYGEASERRARELVKILGLIDRRFELSLGRVQDVKDAFLQAELDNKTRRAILEQAFSEPFIEYRDADEDDYEDEVERAGWNY